MRLSVLFICSCFLFGSGQAMADTIAVDAVGTGDYPTIQLAIAAAENGDVIELADGTYTGDGNRDLDYMGKAITIRSQSGVAASCIIDCEGSESQPRRAVHFHSNEQTSSVLSDVTIQHGWAQIESRGGGIRCENESAPTIIGCIFSENEGAAVLCIDQSSLNVIGCRFTSNNGFEGGGICCEQSSLTVTNCVFNINSADQLGGAIHAHSSTVEINGCEFVHNFAVHAGATDFHINCEVVVRNSLFKGNAAGSSGGICLFAGCVGTIEGCTFLENVSGSTGAAVSAGKSSPVSVSGCTFYANSAPEGALVMSDAECSISNSIVCGNTLGPALYTWTTAVISCCDFHGNAGGDWIGGYADYFEIDGNISLDPQFCDAEAGDFTLQEGSPCAPYSNPNPDCDLIGAWPLGCGGTPTATVSWGGLKRQFSPDLSD
jgi:Right handed beta helix region